MDTYKVKTMNENKNGEKAIYKPEEEASKESITANLELLASRQMNKHLP